MTNSAIWVLIARGEAALRHGRHAQESLLRQAGRQLAPHTAGCAGRQRQTETDRDNEASPGQIL